MVQKTHEQLAVQENVYLPFYSQQLRDNPLVLYTPVSRRRLLRTSLTVGAAVIALPGLSFSLSGCGEQKPSQPQDLIQSLYPELAKHPVQQDLHLKTHVPVRIVNYTANMHVDEQRATILYRYLNSTQTRHASLEGFYDGKFLNKDVDIEQRNSVQKITVVVVPQKIQVPTWMDSRATAVTDISTDGETAFSVIRVVNSSIPPFPGSLSHNVLLNFTTEASQERVVAGDKPNTENLVDTEWWNNSLGLALACRGAGITTDDYSNLFIKGVSRIKTIGGLSYYQFSYQEYTAMPANIDVFSQRQ